MLKHAFLAALIVFLCLVAAPASAQAPAPVEGRDFVVLAEAKPWQDDGKIEVVEVFAYTCGVCAQFQPMVDQWLRSAPADVRFSYVPAAFDVNDAYGRGFFAAHALGKLPAFHHAAFDAIHVRRALPGRGATTGEIASFAASQGFDAEAFHSQMTSADTLARMQAAREFAIHIGLQGTPTLVINGKYRVQGRSLQDNLRIADYLINRERTVP